MRMPRRLRVRQLPPLSRAAVQLAALLLAVGVMVFAAWGVLFAVDRALGWLWRG